ncbi:hypothetical protein GF376_03350 [Candidatus Peregrinibacteria bacterium]|nr:hypothetical protein [Candidatus Peregrinibacteria bacterium]
MFKSKRFIYLANETVQQTPDFDENIDKIQEAMVKSGKERFDIEEENREKLSLITPEWKEYRRIVKKLTERSENETEGPLTEKFQAFGEEITLEMTDPISKQLVAYLNYDDPSNRQEINPLPYIIAKAKRS